MNSAIYTIKLAVPLPDSQITTTTVINITSLGAMQQALNFAKSQGWEVVETSMSHTCETLDEVKTKIEQHMKACGVRWKRLPRKAG